MASEFFFVVILAHTLRVLGDMNAFNSFAVAIISLVFMGAVTAGAHSGGLNGSMEKSMKDMETMKMSGNVDQDFMMMMKSHHAAAIDMANVVLREGTDSQVKALATKIVDAQTKEIAEIDAWLKAHPPKEAKAMQPTEMHR